jgi:hypothetical protein
MRLLDRLEKKLGRYALPNVTVYLIAGQTVFYVLFMMGKLDRSRTWLAADRLLEGEWWRLATFPFDPPVMNLLFFAWYLFYLMGSALEEQGLQHFLLVSYLLTVIYLLVSMSNAFIGSSVFLLCLPLSRLPVILFFVLPVRIKWLALLTWLYYGTCFLADGRRVLVCRLSAISFFFFARDIVINVNTVNGRW